VLGPVSQPKRNETAIRCHHDVKYNCTNVWKLYADGTVIDQVLGAMLCHPPAVLKRISCPFEQCTAMGSMRVPALSHLV
jgi:hypothetical protein